MKSLPGGKDEQFCGLRRRQRRRPIHLVTSHSVKTLAVAGRKGENFLPLLLLKVATLFFLSFLLFFAYQCFPEERRNNHNIFLLQFQLQFNSFTHYFLNSFVAVTLLLATPVRYCFLQGFSLLLEASPCRGAQTQIGNTAIS